MRTATLFGYYGYDNLGDELLCEESIKLLREARFDRIYLLLKREKVKNFSQPQVVPIDRFNPFQILKVIVKSDVVVCGGGGILQDQTSVKSLLYYASIVLIASMFRKPVLLLANSLGPLKHKVSKCVVRSLLKRKNVFFIARDEASYRYAKIVGARNASLGTDLGIGTVERLMMCEKQKKISLCLKTELELDIVIETAKVYGFEVVLVPLSPQDRPACEKMAKKYGLNVSSEPLRELLCSSFVVSQRFHGCLLACLMGSPFVSLNSSKSRRFFERYFPKYEGFCVKEDPAQIALAITKLKNSRLEPNKMIEDFNKMRDEVITLLKGFSKKKRG
ncbi:polysaccharide pyruvyl transferase family protein [Pseudothermotoga sp.]